MQWPALFQVICIVVLAAAYTLYLRTVPDRRVAALELVVIALGAWLAEETSILRYRVYGYPDWWWLKLDEVPLLIVAIWPMVVVSARGLVHAMFPQASLLKHALLVAVVVFIDALLVEVIAVHTGLWAWNLPGYLDVPIIGVLGWSFYAFGISYGLERWRRFAPVVALAVTHALLVVSWYACFKWVSVPLPDQAVYLYTLAMIGGAFYLLARPQRRMSLALAVPRMIASSVFVVLLVEAQVRDGHVAAFHCMHLFATALFYLTAVRWPAAARRVA